MLHPVIDIHAHVFPDALAPQALAALMQPGHPGPIYDGTLSGLLESMDAAGVGIAVTQPVATKPSQVRTINDWAAATACNRIIPFGAMHPDFENPVAELERMARLRMTGFKMHPEYQRCAPDDPRMGPILDAASGLGLIAFFHAGWDPAFPTVLGTPTAFARMLEAHPKLTVILAHLGGFRCWPEVRRTLAGRDVWLDTAYTLGHLEDESFIALVRAHGVERVLWGSDGPWTAAAAELNHLRSLPFTAKELCLLEHANAETLLARRTAVSARADASPSGSRSAAATA